MTLLLSAVNAFHSLLQRDDSPSFQIKPSECGIQNEADMSQFSRRQWLKTTITILGTVATILTAPAHAIEEAKKPQSGNSSNTKKKVDQSSILKTGNNTHTKPKSEFAPVNLTQVAVENKINVTLMCPPLKGVQEASGCVTVDRKTFEKVEEFKVPNWVPPWFRPKRQILKTIPNSELLAAAIIAGAITEMVQTTLLYPLSTVKSRVQATEGKQRSIRRRYSLKRRKKKIRFRLRRRLQVLRLSVKRQIQQGKLFAGIVPSLAVTVPCSGVYYGIRDVTKRMLNMALKTTTKVDDVAVAVIGALVADIFTIIVRTPADVLTIRLQVGTTEGTNETKEEIAGDWINDGVKRLPAAVLTDLPYLLSRIALNGFIVQGNENIASYEVIYIFTATLCALLTTPFDVARTRILVDSNDDPTDGIDGGSREGVWRTLKTVMAESDGGARNLFRGWFERVLYLGIGKAWFGPINIIEYTGIRDAILLKWFD
eukprot:CAMPEP_0194208232 /NCGR_PEP_ID=MMETSP0156-20130528/6742_1 /TAXON_ID=33649 /ORGANISM="Thalassionema nitzschioides, Strain L26-B" /LENGTH=483 /DNA_ID=CAMNT_0038935157 /DNA_START=229 /DNA_END=1680 /DNA_ORIENTATION=-